MKKLFISLMLITTSLFVFAKTGPMAGEKNLKVVKTKWFDIIYPERCYKSASILYQNVDHIFEEVSDEYGLEPFGRMPIVITPAVEQLNAFFTDIPYNHIVLYDTSNNSLGELAVFREDLLSIFRHELTHATTFNMLDKTNRKFTKIFGDALNEGRYFVTTGMAEGATVSEESARGEGRLNDEYAKHSVKQAKIERKFPSYYDIQGAGDLNPYFYNGAFHEWLQKKYGMEAYAKFWYYTINIGITRLTVAKRYKMAFGANLKKDWAQFILDYKVPKIPENPVEKKIVNDFFAPNVNKYSRNNNAGSRYQNLISSEKSLYWLDYSNNSLYTVSKEDYYNFENSNQSSKLKYKIIVTQQGLYSAIPSADDKYLAFSCYSNTSPTVRANVSIFDTKTKRTFTVKERGLKDASIIQSDGDYYLVTSKFQTPNNTIQVFKILTKNNGQICGVEKVSETILPLNVFTSNYVSLGTEGTFAYIKKDKLTFSICIADINGEVLQEYVAPEERMVIHSLSANEQKTENTGNIKTLHFSWAKKDTMPRDGFFTVELKEKEIVSNNVDFYLSQNDISGGIFTPVSANTSVVYIGHFLNQNRLLTFVPDIQNDYEKFLVYGSYNKRDSDINIEENLEFTDLLDSDLQETELQDTALFEKSKIFTAENYLLPESQKYNSFNYFKRGIFIPFYANIVEYISKQAGLLPCFLSLGGTYITASPWSNGNSDLYVFTGAYNAYYNRFDFDILTAMNSDTSLFQSSLEFKTGISLVEGWDSSKLNFMIGSGFNFGRISTLSFKNIVDAALFGGDDYYYYIQDQLSLIYSNVHFTGPGDYEQGGITVTIGGTFLKNGFLNESQIDLSVPEEAEVWDERMVLNYDLFGTIYGFIPRLLPFESTYGLTTNLPTKIGLELFPVDQNIYPLEFLRFSAETILFGQHIKTTVPLINGLFMQDWKISLGYQGGIVMLEENRYDVPQVLHIIDYSNQVINKEFTYKDTIYLKTSMTLSPNIGVFANKNYKGEIYIKYLFNIHRKPEEYIFDFDLGINFSM